MLVPDMVGMEMVMVDGECDSFKTQVSGNEAYTQVLTEMLEHGVKADLEALNEVHFLYIARYIQNKILRNLYI